MFELLKKIIFKVIKLDYGFFFYNYKLKYIKDLKFDVYKIKKKRELIKTNKIKIKLASKVVYEDSITFWLNSEKYSDEEDIVSAHRWIWVYELLDESNISLINKKKIVNAFINNWFVFYENRKISKKDLIFEPYTVSERLANFSILYRLNILKREIFTKIILLNQLNYLILNMEIYLKETSNHLLNNIRAILLYSDLINDKRFVKFGIKTLKIYENKLIDKSGFFKFGSSHYQFIFTKWLLDIIAFSNIKNKVIKKLTKKSLITCNFFLYKKKNFNYIPLIGDVSPDYSPKYIVNFIVNLNKKNLSDFYINNKYKFLLKQKKIIPFRFSSKIKQNEWYKISNKKITLFNRNPNTIKFSYNHAHYDYYHFVLYYKNNPIILDLGKKNYFKSSYKFNSPNYHNSIDINNCDFFYFKNNRRLLSRLLGNKFFNYKVQETKKKLINVGNNKKIKFVRSFNLNKNLFSIRDYFYSKNKKNVKIFYYFSNKLKIKLLDKNLICLVLKNKKILNINIHSNQNFNILLNANNKNKKDFEKYGDDTKNQKLELYFKNTNNINLLLNFNLK